VARADEPPVGVGDVEPLSEHAAAVFEAETF
jgi:hypothetical protein